MTWRTGRKVGRTIYHQSGSEPSDTDSLIGMMDTPELAALAVCAVNRWALPDGIDPVKVLDALREIERKSA